MKVEAFKNKLIFKILVFLVSAVLALSPTARAQEMTIEGNGADSGNSVALQSTSQTVVNQTNSADVASNVDASSNTGENSANSNTGDAAIQTGNAQTTVTTVNVVNRSTLEVGCCPGDTTVNIVGNGAGSQNSVNANITNSQSALVNQNASVNNNITGAANTGRNTASGNNGSVTIDTGNVTGRMEVLNGPINTASVTMAGGTGSIKIKVSENGADSDNQVGFSYFSSNDVVINNSLDVRNNFLWEGNTGENSANDNSGDVKILTGDALLDLFVQNGPINTSRVVISCCPLGEVPPSNPPGGGNGNGEQNGGGNNGKKDGGGGGGGGQGAITPIAAAIGGPQIIGLSDTSSSQAKTLLFWVGLVMAAYGFKVLTQEISSRKN